MATRVLLLLLQSMKKERRSGRDFYCATRCGIWQHISRDIAIALNVQHDLYIFTYSRTDKVDPSAAVKEPDPFIFVLL